MVCAPALYTHHGIGTGGTEKNVQQSWEPVNKKLRPYQIEGADRAYKQHQFMLNYAMRCGKTSVAIEVFTQSIFRQTLIVGPAIARTVWIQELQKWWPDHPEAFLFKYKYQTEKAAKAPIIVTSYGMVKHLLPYNLPLDIIVADESHMLGNARSQRTKAFKEIRNQNIDARVLFLTGTPIADDVQDLWSQLDILHPGAWGSFFKFKKRYCDSRENEYATSGLEFFGLNEEYEQELNQRLQPISMRITREDVKEYLPPLSTETIFIDAPKKLANQDLNKLLKEADPKSFKKIIDDLANAKIKETLQWVETVLSGGTSHALVFTHRIETARTLAEKLQEDYRTLLITGEDVKSPEKRNKLLEAHKLSDRGVIVATMHSVPVAIDLSHCKETLFAELYYYPMTMLQAMARTDTLEGGDPITVSFLVAKGTVDEHWMSLLNEKVSNINKVIRGGAHENELHKAMGGDESEEDFLSRMRDVALSWDED